MPKTYLTTEELASRIKYDPRTVRERLKDKVLIEGTHYIRPFGGRKILYIWEAVERDMREQSRSPKPKKKQMRTAIPMAGGRICRG